MTTTEVSLREYRGSDAEAMFQLDLACFAEEFRFDRKSMQTFAEEMGALCLVAETRKPELAGFVIVQVEAHAQVEVEQILAAGRGYVVTLDVAEQWRRRGLAGRLMAAAEARVASAGAGWMELHVFTGNEGAIRFYERLGYERIGVQRRFYGKRGLDAFVYRKTLGRDSPIE